MESQGQETWAGKKKKEEPKPGLRSEKAAKLGVYPEVGKTKRGKAVGGNS